MAWKACWTFLIQKVEGLAEIGEIIDRHVMYPKPTVFDFLCFNGT